jgi:hypothetical protein
MERIREAFGPEVSTHWNRYTRGGGLLEPSNGKLRLVNASTRSDQYSNAQIDDYQGLRRARFPWRPPLTLTVRARFSHPPEELLGTAGFGFWNDPFLMTERRPPTLPRAIWFFYASPPSDMKLDLNAPGAGWKAATIDALRPASLVLAAVALPTALAMHVPAIYHLLWPPIQDALNIDERLVDVPLTAWHTYRIEWGTEGSCFLVDGEPVLEQGASPRGPLGFVMWLDNQYMVVKPWGRFGWGLLESRGSQWLEACELKIESGRSHA